jgi:hypothetical protein
MKCARERWPAVAPAHGPSDMPIWGDAFSQSEQAGGPEAVQARINELVEHLRSLQVVEKK